MMLGLLKTMGIFRDGGNVALGDENEILNDVLRTKRTRCGTVVVKFRHPLDEI